MPIRLLNLLLNWFNSCLFYYHQEKWKISRVGPLSTTGFITHFDDPVMDSHELGLSLNNVNHLTHRMCSTIICWHNNGRSSNKYCTLEFWNTTPRTHQRYRWEQANSSLSAFRGRQPCRNFSWLLLTWLHPTNSRTRGRSVAANIVSRDNCLLSQKTLISSKICQNVHHWVSVQDWCLYPT